MHNTFLSAQLNIYSCKNKLATDYINKMLALSKILIYTSELFLTSVDISFPVFSILCTKHATNVLNLLILQNLC